jgi:hypothetical protein
MAAPLKTCTTIERGVVRFLWAKDTAAKDIHKEYFRDWIKLIRESGLTDGVLQHGLYMCVLEEAQRLPSRHDGNYEPQRTLYCVGKINLWTHLKNVLLMN